MTRLAGGKRKRLKVHGTWELTGHVSMACPYAFGWTWRTDGVGTCPCKRAGWHTLGLALKLPCTYRRMRLRRAGHVGDRLANIVSEGFTRWLSPTLTLVPLRIKAYLYFVA